MSTLTAFSNTILELETIADLINLCESVDQLEAGTSVSELRQRLDSPSLDTSRDIRLWQDASGTLIGFAEILILESQDHCDGYLWFCVHPKARRSTLEPEIIAWGEARMREAATECGRCPRLHSTTRADREGERMALLERCGFRVERTFFRMMCSLAAAIPVPEFPPGFTLRHSPGESDISAWVEMHNDSFIDHWNHHDLTVEEVKHDLKDPDYRPELDLIALAPDGEFAAFCSCHINREDNLRHQQNRGWISILGTRRHFRRRGLGRAMLLAGMHRLKADGMDAALLAADADNPFQAVQFYESVGFCKVYSRLFYVKHLVP